jgi:hypothetical protein
MSFLREYYCSCLLAGAQQVTNQVPAMADFKPIGFQNIPANLLLSHGTQHKGRLPVEKNCGMLKDLLLKYSFS